MIDVIKEIKGNYISNRECDFIKILFSESQKAIFDKKEKVIIYGAGSAGLDIANCLKLHEVEILCFCDQKPSYGAKLMGLEVISPEELIQNHKNTFIVIGVQRYKCEIFKFLKEQKFTRVGIIENDEQFYYYLQFPRWKIDIQSLECDSDLLNEAYDLLGDEKSKKIFIGRLSALTSYADFGLYKKIMNLSDCPKTLSITKKIFASSFENEMYFENDLIKLFDKCSLVDCGAYDGDSVFAFQNAMKLKNFQCGEIYCFEPDQSNFKKLKLNFGGAEGVTLNNSGVWDKEETLEFSSSELTYPTEAYIRQGEIDKVINVSSVDVMCKVNSIDNVIYPDKVDLIKMDVEGSELMALKGASNTILKWQPQLIISAYHKGSDIYKLVLLINKIYPKYKIYLRQFSFSWSETVAIAKV